MEYKLTQFSHGAGCGCKISPQILTEILGSASSSQNGQYPDLLVGNIERDDAAVYDLGNGKAVVSTTDFFMPIVDDAATFGHIAAVNAISDVYAMGGRPLLAIAILGWPVEKLPTELASQVLDGARVACAIAGIPLAGGHSIDSPEPIFGLAVTGLVPISQLKKNGGAKDGDLLYLTKPLGIGIYSTALKRGVISEDDRVLATGMMQRLNSVGMDLSELHAVHAMTDVTGFGLAGHLLEMCDASGLSATIQMDRLPLLNANALNRYIAQNCIPGGTHRNFASYGTRISNMKEYQKLILCDPQTSGGLLIAVDAAYASDIEGLLETEGLHSKPIGVFSEPVDDRSSVAERAIHLE